MDMKLKHWSAKLVTQRAVWVGKGPSPGIVKARSCWQLYLTVDSSVWPVTCIRPAAGGLAAQEAAAPGAGTRGGALLLLLHLGPGRHHHRVTAQTPRQVSSQEIVA